MTRIGGASRSSKYSGLPVILATIETRLDAEKKLITTNELGAEETRYVPFKLVTPGEEIRYRISYSNLGNEAATSISIQGKVPEEMSLIIESVETPLAKASFSVDQGLSFGPLESLIVKNEDNSTRPARIDDIDTISWTLSSPLNPGETGEIYYSLILE